MEPIFWLLLAVVVVIAVSALAEKIGVSAPLALVIVGILISLLPFVPPIEVEPEWVLAVILPPLLYAAAAAMPAMDFRRDFGIISGFAFILVAITSIVLGVIFSHLIPGLNLAAGIAFGAIVSPTDAVAVKIAERVGIPSRLGTVLNGEVLLNDASALVIMKSAVAAIAGAVSLGIVFRDFLWSLIGAGIVGALIGFLGLRVRRWLSSAALSTAVSLVVPFAAFLPAEEIGASGLVAAVVAGLITGHRSVVYLSARERIFDHTIWHTVETVVEGAVFLLMGLELFALLEDVHATYDLLIHALWYGLLTIILLLVIRLAFVTPIVARASKVAAQQAETRSRLEWMDQRLNSGEPVIPDPHEIRAEGTWGTPTRDVLYRKPRGKVVNSSLATARKAHRAGWFFKARKARADRLTDPVEHTRFTRRITRAIADTEYYLANPLGPREGLLLVFGGMRGAVTLAAAQSLPRSFPNRSFVVLLAFLVAFGSLVMQGAALPWVVRKLDLAPDDTTGDAQQIHLDLERVSAEFLDSPDLRRRNGSPYHPDVIARVRAHLVHPEGDFGFNTLDEASDYQASYRELWDRTLDIQRAQLLEDRKVGTFDSNALDASLTAIDAEQLMIDMKPAAWLMDD